MSTARQLHFRSEAREKVLRGATTLTDAVRGTLGPKARCVLIEPRWGKPLVSHGVTNRRKVVRVALENAVSVAGRSFSPRRRSPRCALTMRDRRRRDLEPALER